MWNLPRPCWPSPWSAPVPPLDLRCLGGTLHLGFHRGEQIRCAARLPSTPTPAKFLKLTGLVVDSVHPDPKSKSFATRCILFYQPHATMKTTITLTQKNSAAIAIDALPRLKLLATASARLRQTEQPVKVGMTVTHKSYGAGKVVGEWSSIRSGVPCKDIL
jgi:hypothetical protein